VISQVCQFAYFTRYPGIDPGMAFNPFPSSIWIRQDSNPQPLDCESSLLTTRLDLRPTGHQIGKVGKPLAFI
jgi:hypothetical protein